MSGSVVGIDRCELATEQFLVRGGRFDEDRLAVLLSQRLGADVVKQDADLGVGREAIETGDEFPLGDAQRGMISHAAGTVNKINKRNTVNLGAEEFGSWTDAASLAAAGTTAGTAAAAGSGAGNDADSGVGEHAGRGAVGLFGRRRSGKGFGEQRIRGRLAERLGIVRGPVGRESNRFQRGIAAERTGTAAGEVGIRRACPPSPIRRATHPVRPTHSATRSNARRTR